MDEDKPISQGGRFHEHKVYTCGYAGRSIDELRIQTVKKDAMIVDIRYAPRSRRAEWNKEALEEKFGDGYRWLHAAGNRNYKSDGPIELVDEQRAVDCIQAYARKRAVILLCGCKDAEYCHRTTVSEALRKRGTVTQELDW